MTSCSHPIPVTSPGPVPTIRYVQCQREAGHEEYMHQGREQRDGKVYIIDYGVTVTEPWRTT